MYIKIIVLYIYFIMNGGFSKGERVNNNLSAQPLRLESPTKKLKLSYTEFTNNKDFHCNYNTLDNNSLDNCIYSKTIPYNTTIEYQINNNKDFHYNTLDNNSLDNCIYSKTIPYNTTIEYQINNTNIHNQLILEHLTNPNNIIQSTQTNDTQSNTNSNNKPNDSTTESKKDSTTESKKVSTTESKKDSTTESKKDSTTESNNNSKQNSDKAINTNNSVLHTFIKQIETLIDIQSPLLSAIERPLLLIKALKKLDEMIEMDTVKQNIMEQLKYLIIMQLNKKIGLTDSLKNNSNANYKQETKKFEGHVLHTVIYGPPGVGKTMVGKILAQIWYALGFINPPPSGTVEKQTEPQSNEIVLTPSLKEKLIETIYVTKIKDLVTQVVDQKNQLDQLEKSTKQQEICLKRLRRRVRRLQKELLKLNDKDDPLDFKNILSIQLNNLDMIYSDSLQLKHNVKEMLENFKDDDDDDDRSENEISIHIEKLANSIEKKSPQDSPKQGNKDNTKVDSLKKEQKHEQKQEDIKESKLEQQDLEDCPITIVSRQDFVSQWVGHSAIKTMELLKQNIGRVLFIDEAYSLINGDRDSYGMEALTVLNQFMSEHSHEICIIFAGYKDLIQKTIFTEQPGLERRCAWTIDIPGYTEKGLAEIFQSQMEQNEWKLDPNVNLTEFFKENHSSFPGYGGDTEKLCFYAKLAYSKKKFDQYSKLGLFEKLEFDLDASDQVITMDILKKALLELNKNKVKPKTDNFVLNHMYL
jgi:hypothetical protein